MKPAEGFLGFCGGISLVAAVLGMMIIAYAFYEHSPRLLWFGMPIVPVGSFVAGHMIWRIQQLDNRVRV